MHVQCTHCTGSPVTTNHTFPAEHQTGQVEQSVRFSDSERKDVLKKHKGVTQSTTKIMGQQHRPGTDTELGPEALIMEN